MPVFLLLAFGCDDPAPSPTSLDTGRPVTTTPSTPGATTGLAAPPASTTSTSTPDPGSGIEGTACSGTAAPSPSPLTGVTLMPAPVGSRTTTFSVPVTDVRFDVASGSIDIQIGSTSDVVVIEVVEDPPQDSGAPPLGRPITGVVATQGELAVQAQCPTQACYPTHYTIALPAPADSVVGIVHLGPITGVDAATQTANLEAGLGIIDWTGDTEGVRLFSDAGNVTAGLRGGSVVDAHASAGIVQVEGPVEGEVCAQSLTGNVTVTNSAADVVGAHTAAGIVTVEVTQTPSRVEATSGAGNVGIDVPQGTYAVTASATVGNVSVDDITIDPHAPSTLTAQTSLGNITINGN